MTYVRAKEKSTTQLYNISKPDLNRNLNDIKITEHRRAAGRLAWVGNGTSPTPTCLVSIALRVAKETAALLNSCYNAYAKMDHEKLAHLRYNPLDKNTIHFRVFSDGSFQSLFYIYSQIGFVFILAKGKDCSNILHWQKSCATRSPLSTKETELLAFDSALLLLQTNVRLCFNSCRKRFPRWLHRKSNTRKKSDEHYCFKHAWKDVSMQRTHQHQSRYHRMLNWKKSEHSWYNDKNAKIQPVSSYGSAIEQTCSSAQAWIYTPTQFVKKRFIYYS